MKIIVFATDSTSTWMMVNALRKDYSELQVVLEQPVSRLKVLSRRVRRVGIWAVIGQFFFMLYLPILKGISRSRVNELINDAGLIVDRQSSLPIKRFDSVNSEECINWLISEKPEIVILNGTRIVSVEVLSSCKAIFLNTHCGITPAYRGVHGAYWALYQGDMKNIGVTVHQVDAGIDTGDILYQEVIDVDYLDNFVTYPVKQYIAGIPLMRRAIADIEGNRLNTLRRDDLTSAIWQHPTLWQYLVTRWKEGVR